MRYRVLVEVESDGTGERLYSAVVPEIPRCFTVAGTWEELEANLHEVVGLALEMEAERGRLYPPPSGFCIQVEIPAA
jgi:predicted RNase H-like HicB family nuclease